jgi:hypothetical protein
MIMSKQVTRFNHIVGNGPKTDPENVLEQIINQCTYLLEEVLETKEAAKSGDWVEVLDGAADVKYIADYLRDLLESVGVQFDKGFKAVCGNNNLKFTTSLELAQKWQEEKTAIGIEAYISETEYEGVTYFTVRRVSNGKVVKFDGFPQVKLNRYVPKELVND